MQTFPQLAEKRRMNRIPLTHVQARLGCSYPWLWHLEMGNYHGPAINKWKSKYVDVLEELIQEQKEQMELCK
jgi:hypothetical protein